MNDQIPDLDKFYETIKPYCKIKPQCKEKTNLFGYELPCGELKGMRIIVMFDQNSNIMTGWVNDGDRNIWIDGRCTNEKWEKYYTYDLVTHEINEYDTSLKCKCAVKKITPYIPIIASPKWGHMLYNYNFMCISSIKDNCQGDKHLFIDYILFNGEVVWSKNTYTTNIPMKICKVADPFLSLPPK